MTAQYTYSWNRKPIVGVSLVGFGLATLFCKLAEVAEQWCNFLGETAWVMVEVLRSVILLADWHAVSPYLCEDSGPLQHLLQIVASIWPLLCVVVSLAK